MISNAESCDWSAWADQVTLEELYTGVNRRLPITRKAMGHSGIAVFSLPLVANLCLQHPSTASKTPNSLSISLIFSADALFLALTTLNMASMHIAYLA